MGSEASDRAARRRHTFVEGLVLCALVGLGAAVGSALRAAASIAAVETLGAAFPWGTLLVNVVGSFAIGFYATRVDAKPSIGTRQRYFVMTGICGGFTTFSLFSLETLRLAAAGDWPTAALNLGLSLVGWLGAVWLGHRLAARCVR